MECFMWIRAWPKEEMITVLGKIGIIFWIKKFLDFRRDMPQWRPECSMSGFVVYIDYPPSFKLPCCITVSEASTIEA